MRGGRTPPPPSSPSPIPISVSDARATPLKDACLPAYVMPPLHAIATAGACDVGGLRGNGAVRARPALYMPSNGVHPIRRHVREMTLALHKIPVHATLCRWAVVARGTHAPSNETRSLAALPSRGSHVAQAARRRRPPRHHHRCRLCQCLQHHHPEPHGHPHARPHPTGCTRYPPVGS